MTTFTPTDRIESYYERVDAEHKRMKPLDPPPSAVFPAICTALCAFAHKEIRSFTLAEPTLVIISKVWLEPDKDVYGFFSMIGGAGTEPWTLTVGNGRGSRLSVIGASQYELCHRHGQALWDWLYTYEDDLPTAWENASCVRAYSKTK